MYYKLFISIIVLTIVLYLTLFTSKNKIPNIIIQTYHNKHKIPQKVYDNISLYGKGYKHVIFDDEECYNFILKNYDIKHANRFQEFKTGAHKADFFRYCYLYKKGGIYLDIKTELIQPISKVFNKNAICYTVLSKNPKQIYQGILATFPKNIFFKNLIEHMLYVKDIEYHSFTKYFYDYLNSQVGIISPGYNKKYNHNWYLFQEKCFTKNQKETSLCKDGIDRYGYCCFVTDNGKQVIKTRYADYPWN